MYMSQDVVVKLKILLLNLKDFWRFTSLFLDLGWQDCIYFNHLEETWHPMLGELLAGA